MFFKKLFTLSAIACLSAPVIGPLFSLNNASAQTITSDQKEIALNENNFPDPVFRNLIYKKVDTNMDYKLSQSEIEYFTELTSVYFDNNQISKADFSNNKKLESLIIANNRLTSIKLPNQEENTTLKYLDVFANKLTSLDLTNLKALNFLHADDNQLTFLDLSHSPLDSGHRLIPAIPIADSKAPIVVGAKQTNNEINQTIEIGFLKPKICADNSE